MASCPPSHLLFVSADELGQQTGTSDATVVRTSRHLGYAGFTELKQEVGKALTASTPLDVRLRAQLTELSRDLAELASRTFDEAAERLQATRQRLDLNEIERAVHILAPTPEVMTYGWGASEFGARYLALKLSRLGKRTRFVGSTGYDLADDLLPLREGHAVVVFAPGKLLSEVEIVLNHARDVGAHPILVTDHLASQLKDRVEATLIAPWSHTGMTAQSYAALLVSDVLVLAVSLIDPETSSSTYSLLTRLREELRLRS
jgi:DNA-binding MurR/RpiR family transcriptional regulator